MKDIYATPGNPPPTSRISLVNPKEEPSALAHNLDVEQVHAILRNAETGNCRQLWALYRDILLADPHIQAEFSKRKLAVIGDPFSLQPWDKDVADNVNAADMIERHIYDIRGFRTACAHLLDGTLYPVAVAEKTFRPVSGGYALREISPVPYPLIDYRSGHIGIYRVDGDGRILSESDPPDPDRYIVHRGHMLTLPDQRGGPMRSIVFWWLLAAMGRTWWARFLDRYGGALLLGRYEKGDEESRRVLESAFAFSQRIGGLVVTSETQVEIQQVAATQSGDAYDKFLSVCRREISKLILGQTLSAEAQPTGMNSGVSKEHGNVRADIRQLDATLLGETLRDQLFEQILRVNRARAGRRSSSGAATLATPRPRLTPSPRSSSPAWKSMTPAFPSSPNPPASPCAGSRSRLRG